MTTFLKDFEGRRATAVAVSVAAAGSAALNIWGASQMYDHWLAASAFVATITAGEVIAFLALRSIVADHENNHFWKARLSTLLMILAVAGCVMSGHKAFHTLSLDAQAKHASIQLRADRAQESADVYHAQRMAGTLDVTDSMAFHRWEDKQEYADRLLVDALKAAPISDVQVWVFLALFEFVKIGGLWSLATPTQRGQTRAQRRATKRQTKIKEAKSLAEFERKLADAKDLDDTNVDGKVVHMHG